MDLFTKKTKTSINFIVKEDYAKSFSRKILFIVVVVFVIGFIAWFGFLDRIIQINKLDAELLEATSELNAIKKNNESLEVTKEEFRLYSNEYMSDDEKKVVDRATALSVVDKYLINNSNVMKIQLNENEITAFLSGIALDRASTMINQMLSDKDSCVSYAHTITANNEKGNSMQTVEMIINLAKENNEE